MRLISSKKYKEMLDKINNSAEKIIELTLDKEDLKAENNLYNTQVNILMGQVSDLQDKLSKNKEDLKKLKQALTRNGIAYKVFLKDNKKK